MVDKAEINASTVIRTKFYKSNTIFYNADDINYICNKVTSSPTNKLVGNLSYLWHDQTSIIEIREDDGHAVDMKMAFFTVISSKSLDLKRCEEGKSTRKITIFAVSTVEE
jgi:hypothetical protein